MKKTIFIIIAVAIVLCIGTVVLSEQISMLFAKDKPDNIIYCHPYLTSGNSMENDSYKREDHVCFYRDGNGIGIKRLDKKSFLHYEFTDAVITDYNVENGHRGSAHGTPGYIPSKNVWIEKDDITIEINCVRAIVVLDAYTGDDAEADYYRNILCCEMSAPLSDGVVFAAQSGNAYEPVFQEISDDKSIYVYDIKQDDLTVLDEITKRSFILK